MSVLFTISQVINCFWSSLFCDLLCKGYFDMLLYQFCKTIMVGLVYQWPCILFINLYAFCLSTFMHFVYRQSCILFIEEYAIFLLTIMHFIYHYLIICLTLFIRRLCPWFIEMSFYQDWKYQLTEWWFELNWLLNQWIVRSFSLSLSFSWN